LFVGGGGLSICLPPPPPPHTHTPHPSPLVQPCADVHESIYDEFVKRAAAKAHARTVGDCFSGAQQGPQVDKEQFDKILSLIDTGVKQGARLVAGGKRAGDIGFFIEPTVFADVQDHMDISRQEIFGALQKKKAPSVQPYKYRVCWLETAAACCRHSLLSPCPFLRCARDVCRPRAADLQVPLVGRGH
jgi:hypothetical protein